ncbi:MAG: alpha/beta fold hydrolase [Pirellulales bacterium]|nr:alpha/beta fold hydrolase [Pirellulales bacterium]
MPRRTDWMPILAALASLSMMGQAAAVEQANFDSAGVKIRYTIDGPADGEPVLLIHGYSASGALNWRLPGVIAALADEYRVITLDNRGHGGSDKPLAPKAYGAEMEQDAIRLLDHLHIDQAHFVGYSMGGMITLKALAEHPERVRSAVVGGMGWREPPTETGWLEALRGEADAATPLAACMRGFLGLTITREQLEGIRVPFICVVGDQDRLIDGVRRLHEVRGDVPVIEVPGATHTTCVMRPELRKAIREFLDSHRMAAAN